MTQTIQALERYTALEQALLGGLETEQLEGLQRRCVQISRDLRSEELLTRFKFGIACLAAALIGTVFSIKFLIWGLALWFCYHLAWRENKKNSYGLLFSLADRSTFAVHEWLAKADEPSNLRRWHEARDGQYGQVEASAVRLHASDQRAMLLAEKGGILSLLAMRIGPPIVFLIFGRGFAAEMIPANTGGLLLLAVIGLACTAEHIRGQYLGAWLPPEKLDPASTCVGEAYNRVVQALDSRGASLAARRTR